MKTVLCFISLLVTFLNVNTATPDSQKDVAKSQIKNATDNAEIINTENAELNNLNEDTDLNPDVHIDDTPNSDTNNDIKTFLALKENENSKRLSDIEKSFDDKAIEQVSEEDDVQNQSTAGSKIIDPKIDSQNIKSNVEKSESDTQNPETQSEGNMTDNIAKNIINSQSITKSKVTNKNKSESKIQNSETNTKESVSKSSEDIEINHSGSEKLKNDSDIKNIENSSSETLSKSSKKVDENESTENNDIVKSENENSITDLDDSESEGDSSDLDIDNYYEDFLNSNLDTETFGDFIGADEDAYSVVDITLPRDTQFEMVKYEKIQNGRKVVLMKLVPVGSTLADDIEQSANNNHEVIIPIKDTNTVQEDTTTDGNLNSNNNKGPTKGKNKNLISVDTTDIDETTQGKNKVTDDIKDSETETFSDYEVVSDVTIEDSGNKFTERSNIVENKNISKSAASNEDNAKWCICYEMLTDIPWVVRMQMGV